MTDLRHERCVPCRAGSPRLSTHAVTQLSAMLPGWRVVTREGIERLERVYEFPDFTRALAFTNRVGTVAEAEGHHPALLTEWGRVTVAWWTHSLGGLHRNDFIMAARTDVCRDA